MDLGLDGARAVVQGGTRGMGLAAARMPPFALGVSGKAMLVQLDGMKEKFTSE